MICFSLAGVILVGTIVSERGQYSKVNVDGTVYTVPTATLRPFTTKKGKK